MTRTPCLALFRFTAGVGAIAVSTAVLLSACSPGRPWDRELTCRGDEQSTASFPAEADTAPIQKRHANRIDFHLRSGQAFVKTHTAPITETGKDQFHFSARHEASWVDGQFDRRTGALSLIEQRELQVEGRTQQVRTTGQYLCS
ncbi:MAG: hypothetical protein AB9M60_16290 [Leptothrix sp. (in: b-proteobacteria)]